VVKKCFIKLILSSKKLSSISLHLVKLTGKSREKIHPKHLIPKNTAWFLEYLKNNDIILDIGCGNGQNSLKAAAKCRQVVGLEINQGQLPIAHREKKRK
jgi:SAM-dependent methyltransferase